MTLTPLIFEPSHHFAGAGKPIEGGKGAVQMVDEGVKTSAEKYVLEKMKGCGGDIKN